MVYTVQFEALVQDGKIEIPIQYRTRIGDVVRVILLAEREENAPNLIDHLLENPLPVRGFQPLSRDEAHARS